MSEGMDSEENPVGEISAGLSRFGIESSGTDITDLSGLPSVLIVTNIDDAIFAEESSKYEFESRFKGIDAVAVFQYLKSFRRARVVFSSPLLAAKARIQLHETQVLEKRIKCYFAQPLECSESGGSPHLQPPALTKQFLISPPASPPVGWEPVTEAEPIINYDLLNALAELVPGEAHEVHPPSQDHPAIVVHTCENLQGYDQRTGKIVQTKRPNVS